MSRMLLVAAMSAAVLAIAPAVQGQGSTEEPERFLYQFTLEGPDEVPPILSANQAYEVELTLFDASQDDSTAAGADGTGSFEHVTTLEDRIISGDTEGWVITTMPQFRTTAGQSESGTFLVRPLVTVNEPYMRLEIEATMRDVRSGITVNNSITLSFVTAGIDAFSATPRGSLELEPSQTGVAEVAINHGGLLPRTYDAEIIENPCGVKVVAIPTVTFQEQGRKLIQFTVEAPEEKLWYFTEDCTIAMTVAPTDNLDRTQRVTVGIVVNGGYVDPMWVFWTLAIIVAAIVLFVVLKRRKEAVEEEILGKPQKPWTIPVERVYLEHLEKEDERAAYVVRHFLMEEEYHSALLWYKSYKKATKGRRAKERVVLRQERKYERFKKKWEKKIAAPIKAADRFEARLQKKLDRKAKKSVRSDRKKWKKIVSKMEAAHEKKKQRELGKWEKAAKKAEKKGQEPPPKPEVPTPDYPPEPQWQRIELEDHKWQAKADKFRRKMIKQQGDLEVKFEKKEARLLAKLQRKVRRIGRKLDDPDFEKEHPIVGSSSES